jgi:hypothetical protein
LGLANLPDVPPEALTFLPDGSVRFDLGLGAYEFRSFINLEDMDGYSCDPFITVSGAWPALHADTEIIGVDGGEATRCDFDPWSEYCPSCDETACAPIPKCYTQLDDCHVAFIEGCSTFPWALVIGVAVHHGWRIRRAISGVTRLGAA